MREVWLQPPEIADIPDDKPVIFLGGPIQGAPDWQSDARDILHNIHQDIIVASPRRDHAPNTGYSSQVAWERHHLHRAAKGLGAILFYLPPQTDPTPGRAYGQTSHSEMDWWLTERSHDPEIAITIGMPGGFGNDQYIRNHIQQEQPDLVISPTLEMTCFYAIIATLPKLRRAEGYNAGWGRPEGSYASTFANNAIGYLESLWRRSQPQYDQLLLPEHIRYEMHRQLQVTPGIIDARALAYRVLTVCEVELEPDTVNAVDSAIRTVILDEDGPYYLDRTLTGNPSFVWQDALGIHE